MTAPTPAPDPELALLAAGERAAWNAWLEAKGRLRAAHERVCLAISDNYRGTAVCFHGRPDGYLCPHCIGAGI
jgi:hypothetical protein